MTRVILAALLLAPGVASADQPVPPPSRPLAAEPIAKPWQRQASVANVAPDLMIVGSPAGVAYRDGLRYLAFARFAAGLDYFDNAGGGALIMADVELGRGTATHAGVHLQRFRRTGLGFTLGAQTDLAGLGVSAGGCWFTACVEARALGLFADQRTFTLALSVAASLRLVRGLALGHD